MFGFDSLKSIHLEITNRCQASCPMCARNIHGGIEHPTLKLTDWTLDEYKQVLNAEVLMQIEHIAFCGEYGEATVNNDLISMCEYSTQVNPSLHIKIQTNGSTRNEAWWTTLAQVLPVNHNVIFALDGLNDTHHLHRQGTDFDKIIKNAQAFIQAGGTAEWQFICFKHNEHQIEEARALAASLGFKQFKIMYSNRFTDNFPVVDRTGAVTHVIQQPQGHRVSPVTLVHLKDYNRLKSSKITCKSEESNDIVINADFKLIPCCMLAYFLNLHDRLDLYTQNGLGDQTSMLEVAMSLKIHALELFEQWGGVPALDVRTHGIKDIINSPAWQTVLKNDWSDPSELSQPCSIACGHNSPYLDEIQSIELLQ